MKNDNSTKSSNACKPMLGDVTCGILSHDLLGHIDKDGCLKKEAHNDNHVFKDQNGKLISWEDDCSCPCGCWDAWERGCGELCVIYGEVDNIS